MRTARVIGTGSYLPDDIFTNERLFDERVANFDVEKERAKQIAREDNIEYKEIIKSLEDKIIFDRWVKQVTGISKRHIYVAEFRHNENFIGDTENMGLEAAKKAIEAANIKVSKIDYIVFATFTPGYQIPNAACSLAGLLGSNASTDTINAACSGFINGIKMAYANIAAGLCNTALVVSAETLTKRTNYKDPTTAVLFADGAGAAVLQAAEKGIISVYTGSDYSKEHIRLEDDGLIEMGGGPDVLKRAVRAMNNSILKVLEKSPYKIEDVDYIIPHQANARITRELAKSLDFPKEKFCETIRYLGNTSGASVAIALDKAVRKEIDNCEIKESNKVILSAVGGGYTYGAVFMENIRVL